MNRDQLQEQCELGQQHLFHTNYLEAERILDEAEQEAWRKRDFDTLARVYMPLQEARRQRRQRCSEGDIRLDLIARGPADQLIAESIVEQHRAGQLLVAGWASTEPARLVRYLQQSRGIYLEVFLGAVYPTTEGNMVAVVPCEIDLLPPPTGGSVNDLMTLLPPRSLLFREDQLPRGNRQGDPQVCAEVMAMWQTLHAPFLAAADAEGDPIRRIEAYRLTIQVDYACESAHQKLSDLARELARVERE